MRFKQCVPFKLHLWTCSDVYKNEHVVCKLVLKKMISSIIINLIWSKTMIFCWLIIYKCIDVNSTIINQVEISCRGQQLPPSMTLISVRDSIWCSSTEAVGEQQHKDDPSTAQFVMNLLYGRSKTSRGIWSVLIRCTTILSIRYFFKKIVL